MSADPQRYADEALVALGADCAVPLASATEHVPARAGLYAIHGGAGVWRELGLSEPPDARPLYAGKAEESLVARDLDTHFGDGRTGWSTVRRSFAALLHDALGLRGLPRNIAKPGYFASYGLSPEHDAALTAWMREHLTLTTWAKPADCDAGLAAIERVRAKDRALAPNAHSPSRRQIPYFDEAVATVGEMRTKPATLASLDFAMTATLRSSPRACLPFRRPRRRPRKSWCASVGWSSR